MALDGKFSAETVLTLSKRAALLCSNPDCGALTSGPTAGADSSINIGEAAHIYGRTTSTARYEANLTINEVSDITNGIWLCRNCHKLIDSDVRRFPADLLFEWRRLHEQAVLNRLGKPGDKLREKLETEHLQLFEGTSRLAQQIVIDRPPLWEFKLTTELLRTNLGSIYLRWQQLKQGMYARKSIIVPTDQLPTWLSAKLDDLAKFLQSVQPLVQKLNEAFGPPGKPGNDVDILTVCRFVVLAAQNLLEWEEDVRFSHVDEEFRQILLSMQDVAARQLDQLLRIPNELSKILAMENPRGLHELNLVFTLPDEFADNFNASLKRAFERVRSRR